MRGNNYCGPEQYQLQHTEAVALRRLKLRAPKNARLVDMSRHVRGLVSRHDVAHMPQCVRHALSQRGRLC